MTHYDTNPSIDRDHVQRVPFSGIEQRVLKRMRALELGDRPRIVVGFSGGADSLGLALVLANLARRGYLDPLLVHVNHRLRPEADGDALAAMELAAEAGLPSVTRVIIDDLTRLYPGVGTEEAARRERYRQLALAAVEWGCRTIAVAHHQNDQAETVLLHLLRGSGLTGAGGMAERTLRPIPWWREEPVAGSPFTIWRPLLAEPETEIDAIVAAATMTPLEDASNGEEQFRRNQIRHSVLPAIDRVFPDGRAALVRFASLAREEDALLTELAEAALKRAVDPTGNLMRSAIMAEPVPIRRRMLAQWLGRYLAAESVRLERVEAVHELVESGAAGREIEIGEGVSIVVNGDVVHARQSAWKST